MKRNKNIIQQIKHIPVEKLIRTVINVEPAINRGIKKLYHSFIRDGDSTPSLQINTQLNCWYDFGPGIGGNNIDLLMHYWRTTDINEILNKIKEYDDLFSFVQTFPQTKSQSTTAYSLSPIHSPGLKEYLKERKISFQTASRFLQEVHYEVNGKNYYSLAFKNRAGGWELRNRYNKRAISPKDFSLFEGASNKCLVFEGFMDMLSYLELNKNKTRKSSIIVLNSLSMLDRAMNQLLAYYELFLFLDNDDAGKKATQKIITSHKSANDFSIVYKNFKDLNEYLISSKKTIIS